MKNVIFEINNTLERRNCRLDEAKDWISDLEDKVEKITQAEQEKEKIILKNEESLRNILYNMKCNNISIVQESYMLTCVFKSSPEQICEQQNSLEEKWKCGDQLGSYM